jgi:hypothetical protein
MVDETAESHLTLAETARRMGETIWFEERLFEVVGALTGTDLPPSDRVVYAEVSRRHAWRAAQVRARLPEVPGFAADDVVGPPDPAAVAALESATPTSVVGDLLPRVEALYTAHIERCSPVSDASVARTLDAVRDDLRRDAAVLRTML